LEQTTPESGDPTATEGGAPQTEPEAAGSDSEGTPGGLDTKPEPTIPQTEPEEAASQPGNDPEGTPSDKNSLDQQTDPKKSSDAASDPKPKKRKTKKPDAAQEDGADQSESGTAPDSDIAAATPNQKKRRPKSIVSIDETRSVATLRDQVKSDLLDLVESMKARKILTDTIQGVERSEENPDISYAVIYHGEFKVIIPAEQLVDPPEDFRDRSPSDVMHYLITKRLGAEVDYIVKGVDQKTGIAAASRLEAMALKRRQYYYGTDRDGNNLLYEGSTAEARVVSVIRAGIFVDLFGVECYIPLKELSYQRLMDASSVYQPGQRVLVKILELKRNGRDDIHVNASVKQAGANPYERALRKYNIGSRYVGTVSLVDTTGVFVSLDGGIDCLCSYPKRGRPPRGSRVTVRILGINHESNRIWGAITHMTSR